MYRSFVFTFKCSYDAFICSSYYNLCRISNCLTALNYDRFINSLFENFDLDPAVIEYDPDEVVDSYSCFIELII